MIERFKQLINIGVERFHSRVDQTHQRLFNICCIVAVCFSCALIVYDFWLGTPDVHLKLLYFASACCFAGFILLNYQKQHRLASYLAAITPLILVWICIKITGTQIHYELLLIGFAMSPYLFFVQNRFIAFGIFFLYIVGALEIAFIEVTPLIYMEYATISNMDLVAKSSGVAVLLFGTVMLGTLSRAAMQEIENQRDTVKKAKEEVERSERLKTTFLKNMSHEIRTPLNGIIGFTDMIMDDSMTISEQERDEYAEIINKSSQQLLSIMSNVLDISKIEIGEIGLEYEAVDVKALIEHLLQKFEWQALDKGLSFAYRLGNKDEACVIETDKKKIEQILSSLLSNAIKFTKKGKIQFSYDINHIANTIIFKVNDTGPGIPRHLHEQIFESFHRMDIDASRGAGLGLAISQGFANMLGGRITLESMMGQGTTFYVSLPYIEASLPVVAPKVEVKDTKVIQEFGKKKVLVAEDETFNYKLLEALLKQLGYEVLWAKNGQIAVDLATEHPDLDLILMDIKMPIMNGIEATEKIRAIYPNVPIVGQSAFAFANEQEQSIEAGCNAYLTKPIKRKELLDTMTALFGRQNQ